MLARLGCVVEDDEEDEDDDDVGMGVMEVVETFTALDVCGGLLLEEVEELIALAAANMFRPLSLCRHPGYVCIYVYVAK